MNKKTKQDNQPITRGYLDKAFKSYTKAITDAMDFGFRKNDREHKEMRDEIKETRFVLEEKIDNTRTLLDGYVNAQESFKQEFEVVEYRQSKVEKVIKSKLGVEIE
jgi:hypothetical protein